MRFDIFLGAQALLYIVLLRLYLRKFGAWPDVWDSFIAYWIIVVVPASFALAAAGRFAYRRWVRDHPERRVAFFAGALVVDVVLLLISFAFYAERVQG